MAFYSGHITQTFGVEATDRYGTSLGDLDMINGGTVEMSTYAPVRASGNVILTRRANDIDWLQTRLRPYLIVDGVRWNLGAFVPTVPGDAWGDVGVELSVEMADRTSILQNDAIEETLVVAKGTNAIEFVYDLIESTGEEPGAITPSDDLVEFDITFKVGTDKLTIANEVLRSVGFSGLEAGRTGEFIARPAFSYDRLPVSHRLFSGEDNRNLLPQLSREQDISAIPNVVIVSTQGDEQNEGFKSVYINDNPDSPTSIVNVPRKAHVEEGVEIHSQEALDDYARLRMGQLSSRIANLDIGAIYDGYWLDQIVQLDYGRGLPAVNTYIGKMSVPLSETNTAAMTLREVAQI